RQSAASAPKPADSLTPDARMPYPEPKGPSPEEAPETQAAVTEFARGVWEEINPATMLQGSAQAVTHPLDTLQGMGSAQDAVRQRGVEEWKRGNYGEAINHWANYLMPLFGPHLDEMEAQA